MAITGKTSTFTRYHVPKPNLAIDFWAYADTALRVGSFEECEYGQERSCGFTSFGNMFDFGDSFPADCRKGEYVAFGFRTDERKIPAAVLKEYMHDAVENYKAEHDGKWPPRQERLEMQEEIRNSLLTRIPPTPSVVEVVWNSAGHLMLVGTTSAKVLDDFLEHFEKYFNAYPKPLYHMNWALYALTGVDGNCRDALASLDVQCRGNSLEKLMGYGYEFLTWLWWKSEAIDFAIPGEKSFGWVLGDKLTLCLPGDGKESVTCRTSDSHLYEAREALKQNKMVSEAQFSLSVGGNDYFVTLNTALQAIKGLKTPKQLPADGDADTDGVFLEKMYFVEEVQACLDALYLRFINERMADTWERETLPAMKKWMNGEV